MILAILKFMLQKRDKVAKTVIPSLKCISEMLFFCLFCFFSNAVRWGVGLEGTQPSSHAKQILEK